MSTLRKLTVVAVVAGLAGYALKQRGAFAAPSLPAFDDDDPMFADTVPPDAALADAAGSSGELFESTSQRGAFAESPGLPDLTRGA